MTEPADDVANEESALFHENYGFNPKLWLAAFKHSTMKGHLRMAVQHGTWKTCTTYQYTTLDGCLVELPKEEMEEDVRHSVKYDNDYEWPTSYTNKYTTVVRVINGDCLEVALDLKNNQGLNPAVLNMANANHPGGGYRHGAGAQEENLCRRTNLYQHIEDPDNIDKERKWRYPIDEFGTIYSPNVVVFRDTEANGYGFLNTPHRLSIISAAAYCRPQLKIDRDANMWLTKEKREGTRKKIRAILHTGLVNGHDAIVLSAFGCGAFCNPPKHIAQLFREVIEEPVFRNAYKMIVFAIFDDHNARRMHNPEGNVKPFMDVFGQELVLSNAPSAQ